MASRSPGLTLRFTPRSASVEPNVFPTPSTSTSQATPVACSPRPGALMTLAVSTMLYLSRGEAGASSYLGLRGRSAGAAEAVSRQDGAGAVRTAAAQLLAALPAVAVCRLRRAAAGGTGRRCLNRSRGVFPRWPGGALQLLEGGRSVAAVPLAKRPV